MKITVAALMTPAWIAKRLELPPDVTRIMIPGLCEGDPAVLSEQFGIPAEKGPADLKRLPAFFGQADARSRYGARDVRVFAEINNVARLDRERIVEAASYYRDAGADVIDLGLSLDRNWLDEGPDVIADLKARGFTLSIDTLDPDEILMADAAGVDYVLSLNGHNRHIAQRLRATPVLIPDTPDDLDSLDATIAHLQALGKPFLVDPIIEPIGSGFAASLGRYLETRRRHPDVEMLMGIGNLTELTEADTTGVTAMLLGFCQELGIRNVLTTEVIDWARGAVREAVLAAQLMHFAQQEGTPPKHVDGRLLTIKDEEVRPYTEAELRELHASITDPNIRIFADADWIYAFNAERFVKGTDINAIFDELGVDEHTHAFYLGKELMKASIARGLGKNYRQESPLDWGYLTFAEPRRERVRLTARSIQAIARREDRGGIVKRILLQLDTEEHPSPFDAIVAHDADVDVLLSHGNVKREDARALAQDAFFTRGPDDLKNTAIWVGGKHVAAGEEIFAEVQKAFFGPFKVSVMLDSNGCNTTAATTIARIAKSYDLDGKRAVVLGLGSVGLRSAILLQKEGCEVAVAPLPADLFDDDRPYRRPRGLDAAENLGLDTREPKDRSELEAMLDGAQVVLTAGPAGVEVLRQDFWSEHPSIEVLADYNAADPLGLEGTKATDDLVDYDGKLVLGALAIGGPKMKVHKTCIRRMFESNDKVFDTDTVYEVAKELV